MLHRSFLTLIFLLSLRLAAQNSIEGVVVEKGTNEALPGVNVYIPDLSIGTVTDSTGFYQLNNLPQGEYILQFSYVGFETLNEKIILGSTVITLNAELDQHVIQGEEVVVSGNFTTTQHDNTIKISTMGIAEITKTSAPSLIESITKVPGVNMISKGPGIITPVIRGLSLNNIMVLNNGVPMQNFQFSENHPYLLDETGLRRIEIIKGPASLIYGSGAVGGVINLIPEPVASKGKIGGVYNLRYFTNTVGVSSNICVKGNQNDIVWGIGGGINSNKDYIQGDNQFAPNTRFNSYNINIDAGIIRKIGIFRLYYRQNKSLFGMANMPAIELVTENKRKNEYWYQDLTDNLIISKNRMFFGAVKIDIDLSYQNNNRQLKGDKFAEEFNLVDMTLQTIAFTAKATHNVTGKIRYIIGTQGMFMSNKNGDAPDHVMPDATSNDISFFGLFQYRMNSVKLEAGLRYNYLNIDVPYQEAGGHDHGEEEDGEEDEYIQYDGQFENLSGSLGTTWNINEINLLRLNLATAFRSPNLAELTQHGRHGIRFEEGNPNLTMQQNIELDLGYHLHTRHTTLDLSLFYNHIFNYIHLAPSTDTTDDGDIIYRYEQAESRLFGGEVSLHIHPHPLDWLHIEATYSQVQGEYISGGYLPRIPANKLYFELRLDQEKWKGLRDIYLEGGIGFIFAQNNPSRFEGSTPAYNLINMGFGFGIQMKRNRLSITITASNLLNVKYYDHLSTLQDVGIYNMGRNVMVGLRLPFNLKN